MDSHETAKAILAELDRGNLGSQQDRELLSRKLQAMADEDQFEVQVELAKLVEDGRDWAEMSQEEQDFVIFLSE